MNPRKATLSLIVVLVLATSGCAAVDKVASSVTNETTTPLTTGQTAFVDALAAKNVGLDKLLKSGYKATGIVEAKGVDPRLELRACDALSTAECQNGNGTLPTSAKPDVYIILSETPKGDAITPQGGYQLAYPVGINEIKFQYLCTVQGQPVQGDAIGLTEVVVGQFSEIGAQVVNAANQVVTIGNGAWKCDKRLVA